MGFQMSFADYLSEVKVRQVTDFTEIECKNATMAISKIKGKVILNTNSLVVEMDDEDVKDLIKALNHCTK